MPDSRSGEKPLSGVKNLKFKAERILPINHRSFFPEYAKSLHPKKTEQDPV